MTISDANLIKNNENSDFVSDELRTRAENNALLKQSLEIQTSNPSSKYKPMRTLEIDNF